MVEYLKRSETDSDLEEFLKENIFFTIIPFEDRDIFRQYLEQANSSNKPIRIEHHIRCGDASLKDFEGWISTTETENHQKEFVFIYTPKNEESNQNIKENSYFNAFKNAYDIIFEINYVDETVECVHGKNTSDIGALYDVVMTLDSARDFWINNYVFEDDREMMRTYLEHICSPTSDWGNTTSIQSKFRIRWTHGMVNDFIGIAIKLNPSTVLFCCKKVINPKFTAVDSKELVALNKLDACMNNLVKYDKDALGMFLFEEHDGKFLLIFASKKIRNYLKISQDEYLSYISQEVPSEKCLEDFKFSPENFKKLIQNKQLDYTVNLDDDKSKKIILTCTTYAQEHNKVHKVLIHDELTMNPTDIPTSGVFVRTFGHFDVFVDGQPIMFTNSKEKELMALLIDRNGGTLTASEAITYLYEDAEVNERTSVRFRKLAMNLKNTLTKYNIEHIVINHHGVRNIDVTAITCDYYELLAGNKHYQKMFHNQYMTDYSWAEETLATLWDYS
jgi:hypothetical protein